MKCDRCTKCRDADAEIDGFCPACLQEQNDRIADQQDALRELVREGERMGMYGEMAQEKPESRSFAGIVQLNT